DRPYRRKMTDVQATAILLEQRGIMYDARVVDAFIELLPELRRGDMDVQQRFQEGASGVPPLPSPDRIAVADDDRVTTHALRRAGRSAAVDVARAREASVDLSERAAAVSVA